MHDDHDDDDLLHRGLAFDLGTVISRRRVLAAAIGTGAAVVLAACSSGGASSTTTATTAPDATTPTTTRAPRGSGGPGGGPPGGGGPGGGGPGGEPPGGGMGGEDASAMTTNPDSGLYTVPEETNGPYPADGTNGINVLAESGIVRRDITSSFGAASGTAAGVAMTLRMTVLDVTSGDPLAGAAVYVWHCDAAGRYSLYSPGAEDENYLRGVQVAGADGSVEFTSIWPACYAGRWPHIHYEVYPSEASITNADNRLVTSQIALPDDVNMQVYALAEYDGSPANYEVLTLETDGIFSDGTTNEIPDVSGTLEAGFTVALTAPVTPT